MAVRVNPPFNTKCLTARPLKLTIPSRYRNVMFTGGPVICHSQMPEDLVNSQLSRYKQRNQRITELD